MKKKTQKKVQKKGFTLIEILVVSTIVIIVSAIGLVSYSGAQVSARDAQRKQDLDNVRTTLLLYRSENGYYPIASLDSQPRVTFSFPRQVVARLTAVFRVPEAQAAIAPGDDSSEEDTGKGEATPTPIFETAIPVPQVTPTPTPPADDDTIPTPVPTIVPGTGTQPQEAADYVEMSAILVEEGYLEDELPLDPVNDNTYYYGYSTPDGSSFELTARLEKDGSVVTLTN